MKGYREQIRSVKRVRALVPVAPIPGNDTWPSRKQLISVQRESAERPEELIADRDGLLRLHGRV